MKNFAVFFNNEKFKYLRTAIYFAFSLLSLLCVFLLLFAPICVREKDNVAYVIKASNAFTSLASTQAFLKSFAIIQLCMFCIIVVSMIILFAGILIMLFSYKNEEKLLKTTRNNLIFSASFVSVYTAFTFLFSPLNVFLGGKSSSKVNGTSIIIVALISLLFALFVGFASFFKEKSSETPKKNKLILAPLVRKQTELFIYTVICTAISVISLLSRIVVVKFEFLGSSTPTFAITGKDFIFNPQIIASPDERMIAFALFALFFLTVVSLFLALIAFLSRSIISHKFSLAAIVISSFSCLLVGLFGKYYDFVQKLNVSTISNFLENLEIKNANSYVDYSVSSHGIYFFIGILLVITVVVIRHPYTSALEIEHRIEKEKFSRPTEYMPQAAVKSSFSETDNSILNADPCPAFSAIDSKYENTLSALKEKQNSLFKSPSLASVVNFIVQYAKNSRLHLFYTPEKIAAFLAGLGSTKLTILQGMSGTGKTSLPKIVAEALFSVCDIVEVESSWRDKNELLGYYNEFSKTYNPKKFTQALYKASLNPDTLTFIVLDEMNLSRIEYYFSDFLSLMENEPENREIKLLNHFIAPKSNGTVSEYKGLTDGNTIKIPQNIWFIGTANRDESTYDISDKVYDRAHTMNFDKRASSTQYFSDELSPKYLPVSTLISLFEEAKKSVNFKLEQTTIVSSVEKLLEPYNISFGNRIALQIESFVSIYVACFAPSEKTLNEALDIILLSKTVRKLELKSIIDKDILAEEFKKLNLVRCSDFILSLKED